MIGWIITLLLVYGAMLAFFNALDNFDDPYVAFPLFVTTVLFAFAALAVFVAAVSE